MLISTLTFLKFHTGDCRGMIVSKIKSPDGQLVTREAKLSMHELHQDDVTPSYSKIPYSDKKEKNGCTRNSINI